ncbi:MAG: hypothetical protein JXB26_14010 [Candidatus Aminicenantes bacterium]|nr:hypothetical protein [Candidatus Aminicenantes bacterium]
MEQSSEKKTTGSSVYKRLKKPKCFLVIFIIIMMTAFLPALAKGPLFQLGMSGQGGFPTGVFRDNIGTFNAGFGFDFIFSPIKSRLAVGVSFGILFYGSESSGVFFQAPNADFNIDVTTTNSIYLGHILFRYRIKGEKIKPYLDALVGLSHLTTDTQIDDVDSDDPISTNNYRDTALSFGGGGGLMVRLYHKPGYQNSSGWEIMLDLKARYINGGEAEYLKEGGISREDNRLIYDLNRSRTNLFTTQVGVIFHF